MKRRHHVQAGMKVYFLSMVLVLTMKSVVIVSCLLQLKNTPLHAVPYARSLVLSTVYVLAI